MLLHQILNALKNQKQKIILVFYFVIKSFFFYLKVKMKIKSVEIVAVIDVKQLEKVLYRICIKLMDLNQFCICLPAKPGVPVYCP